MTRAAGERPIPIGAGKILPLVLVALLIGACGRGDPWLQNQFADPVHCVPAALRFDLAAQRSANGLLEARGYRARMYSQPTAYYDVKSAFYGATATELAIPGPEGNAYVVTVDVSAAKLARNIQRATGKTPRLFSSNDDKPVAGEAYLIPDSDERSRFVCMDALKKSLSADALDTVRKALHLTMSHDLVAALIAQGLWNAGETAVAFVVHHYTGDRIFAVLPKAGGGVIPVNVSAVEAANLGKLGIAPRQAYSKVATEPVEWMARSDGAFQLRLRTTAVKDGKSLVVEEPLVIRADGTPVWR